MLSAQRTKLVTMGSYVQIRNVPEEIRRALKARAAARGESFNTYLLNLLEREASRPTVAEVLDRAARRSPGSDESVVETLRAARAEREKELRGP